MARALPGCNPRKAREKALAARRLRDEGVDPIEARRTGAIKERLDAARAITFNNAPIATSTRTERAGTMPSTLGNGKRRSAPMPGPSSERCPRRLSTRRLS